MDFRLKLSGSCFALVVACIVVSIKSIDASLAGFVLIFAFQYINSMTLTLRYYADVEIDMNATERILEYSQLPIEDQTGRPVPAAWPTSGRLEVNDLVAGYAPDLPPVLKGLSFVAESGQRVGLVGRTGAGKSSLTLALFRFLEAREGQILIDGIDISTITLQSLRSHLAIIPQDPPLFSGTLRSNLDVFNRHTDQELWDVLERVHLIKRPADSVSSASSETSPPLQSNANIFQSIYSQISEGGLNLSQGQRQLLCLARAMLARPKLMVLDEATSAVDFETDELIQRSLRQEFKGSTLLVIAHRLSTVADFDRILVLSEGRAVEFGKPEELLAKEGGLFGAMVAESGEKEQLETIISSRERR